MAEPRFQLFQTRVSVAALAVTGISVVALIVAAAWLDGVDEIVVSSIGSSFLAVGAITILYDAYLRTAFTSELLELVGIQRNLADAGIRQICEEPDLRWNEFLADGRDYRVVLLDPTTWVDREWPHVLTAGRLRPITVEVMLVEPNGLGTNQLAENLSLTSEELRQRIVTAQRVLEDSWKTAARSDPPLQVGSSLTVRLSDKVPAFVLAVVDRRVVMLSSGVLGRYPGEGTIALRFDTTNSMLTQHWFEEQLAHLESLRASYANEVA